MGERRVPDPPPQVAKLARIGSNLFPDTQSPIEDPPNPQIGGGGGGAWLKSPQLVIVPPVLDWCVAVQASWWGQPAGRVVGSSL